MKLTSMGAMTSTAIAPLRDGARDARPLGERRIGRIDMGKKAVFSAGDAVVDLAAADVDFVR